MKEKKGKFLKQCENVLIKELFKGTDAFLRLIEYLHQNYKGKKGPVQKICGVILLKSDSKRPLFTGSKKGGYKQKRY
jgi:hypothetical protein